MTPIEESALAALAANNHALEQAHSVIVAQRGVIRQLLTMLDGVELPPEMVEMVARCGERVH